jgi:hypothetical protein
LTVGITATRIVGNYPNRLGLTFLNLSSNVIYIGFLPNVSTTNGLRVAGGGSLTLKFFEDFSMVSREYYAISDAGAANAIKIFEVEGIRED